MTWLDQGYCTIMLLVGRYISYCADWLLGHIYLWMHPHESLLRSFLASVWPHWPQLRFVFLVSSRLKTRQTLDQIFPRETLWIHCVSDQTNHCGSLLQNQTKDVFLKNWHIFFLNVFFTAYVCKYNEHFYKRCFCFCIFLILCSCWILLCENKICTENYQYSFISARSFQGLRRKLRPP